MKRRPDDRFATTHRVRVSYIDTDRGDVMHHAGYLRYLEEARVEYMRARGLDYRSLELDSRMGLPVVEARVRYRQPARFDDGLEIETWIGDINRAKLRFDSLVRREDQLIAIGEITLCCIELPEGKLRSMPPEILALQPSLD